MPTKDASRNGRSKKTAARKGAARPAKLAAALAEAAWAEADAALAEALIEFDMMEHAGDRAARADALALLGQALSRAARKRGFSRLGKVGAREPFDATRHAPMRAASRPPNAVRILAPGVGRGGEILAKARVTGARARSG